MTLMYALTQTSAYLNWRTARMKKDGAAYLSSSEKDKHSPLPEYWEVR